MEKSISIADIVFEKIEDAILSGEFKKGDIITELKLCELLEVSRTPVREALTRLRQEGLIKESGKSFSDVLGELMEIMTEDNFFDLIGLNQMFQTTKRGRKKKENTEVGESTSNEE